MPAYVNVYEVQQAYGGPEEGGWWYDQGTPLASFATECPCPRFEYEGEEFLPQWHGEACPVKHWVAKAEGEFVHGFKDEVLDSFVAGALDMSSDPPPIMRGEVASTGRRVVAVEEEPGQHYPSERPHYE